MSISHKKVVVRRITGNLVTGYLAPSNFLMSGNPILEDDAPRQLLDLLDLEGRSLPIPLSEIKLICFVRDFNREDTDNPERLTRRAFLARPRAEGLWLRVTFTTGDQLEGVAPQDITLLDALLEDAGIFLTPPDERANTHRIYVPRSAITRLEFLSVIQAPGRNKPAKHTAQQSQPTLFAP